MRGVANFRISGETPIAAAAPLRPSCPNKPPRRESGGQARCTRSRTAPMIRGLSAVVRGRCRWRGRAAAPGAPPPGPSRAFTQARSGQEDRAGGSQLIAWCGGRAGPSEVRGAAQPVTGYSGYSEHPEQPNAPGDAWRRPDVAHPRPAANHTGARARKHAGMQAHTRRRTRWRANARGRCSSPRRGEALARVPAVDVEGLAHAVGRAEPHLRRSDGRSMASAETNGFGK